MTSLHDKEQAHENKYAYDQEQLFRILSRRNKLLGMWAAGKLGKSGEEAEAYGRDVALAFFDGHGHGEADMFAKLTSDLAAGGHNVSEADLRREMADAHEQARLQIVGE